MESGFLKKFGIKEPEPKELIEGKKEGFDINKALVGLHKRAGANDTSVGYCARYVRWALVDGGIKGAANGGPHALNFGPFLTGFGFKEVPNGNYQIGDIAVIESFTGNPYGHVHMWNGDNWVSDFVQNQFYPGKDYRRIKPNYKTYRWE